MNKSTNSFMLRRIRASDDHYIRQISRSLSLLRNEYPGFHRWFNTTVKTDLPSGRRQIWIALSPKREIAGVLILKKHPEEKKICTLYVYECFRNQGVGTILMKTALHQLGTNTPLATVSSNHINEYSRLLKNFQFQPNRIYKDYYCNGLSEISFNGELFDARTLLERNG